MYMDSSPASISSRTSSRHFSSESQSTTDSGPSSEATSDEQPDLGAFGTVLRAWTHLQPPPRISHPSQPLTSSSQSVTSASGIAPAPSSGHTVQLDDRS